MHPATGSCRAHSESAETTERRRVNSGSGLGSTSQRFLQSGFTRAQSLRSFSPLRFVPCCADFNRLVYLPQLRENVARQNTGNGQGLVRRQKMFLFVPFEEGWKVKRLVCRGRLSPTGQRRHRGAATRVLTLPRLLLSGVWHRQKADAVKSNAVGELSAGAQNISY